MQIIAITHCLLHMTKDNYEMKIYINNEIGDGSTRTRSWDSEQLFGDIRRDYCTLFESIAEDARSNM